MGPQFHSSKLAEIARVSQCLVDTHYSGAVPILTLLESYTEAERNTREVVSPSG
jgi:hypothetical protein